VKAQLDFLVVTALDIEYDAVVSALVQEGSRVEEDHFLLPTVRKGNDVTVAAISVGQAGTNGAEAVTQEAIARLQPRGVILAGIAAGFPESGVSAGDVLVPQSIVPYELAKLKPGFVEHRGWPFQVSYPMWRAAHSLGSDSQGYWKGYIQSPRPDGSSDFPRVHSESGSVLGSGEKLVADVEAEARKWLLAMWKTMALGLEMEAFGVVWACRMTDTPFLVIKAVQDAGNASKDATGSKDSWRSYSVAAAASFAVAFLKRFEHPNKSMPLMSQFLLRSRESSEIIAKNMPSPTFSYKIAWADSYSQLRLSRFSGYSNQMADLLPTDLKPDIALHGGGGGGKTTVLRGLFRLALERGLLPIILDLKKYGSGFKNPRLQPSEENLTSSVVSLGSIPKCTWSDLQNLASTNKLLVMVDGLNEVTKEVRATLIQHLVALRSLGECYILATDRLAVSDSVETFQHAKLEALDTGQTEAIIDAELGKGTFSKLGCATQEIYRVPFFLSLALKTKGVYPNAKLSSAVFHEFFTSHLHWKPERILDLSLHVVESYDGSGDFNIDDFNGRVSEKTRQQLEAAGVLAQGGRGFEHHLWRDYLASTSLARNQAMWTPSSFDSLTSFSSSLEALTLAIEQLQSSDEVDRMLKSVYDWNYVAAASCLATLEQSGAPVPKASRELAVAILALISEKRFDKVQRTRERAEAMLAGQTYSAAAAFKTIDSIESLCAEVGSTPSHTDWFLEWRTLFTWRLDRDLTRSEVDAVDSQDPVIGWTAANLMRRGRVSAEVLSQLRERYVQLRDDHAKGTVRWRIVHALGGHPSEESVRTLTQALNTDMYHWVRYGAARSLLQIASQGDGRFRDSSVGALASFVEGMEVPNPWVRQLLLREIVEAAFVGSPPPDWAAAVRPLLDLACRKEPDQEQRALLERRVGDFSVRYPAPAQ
jgi:nucleoside phosphorylase